MRPYVILNAAMTLDGKIATQTGSSNISGEDDFFFIGNDTFAVFFFHEIFAVLNVH